MAKRFHWKAGRATLPLLFFLLCSSIKAQITFQLTYGDTNHSDIQAVVATADGKFAGLGSALTGDSLSDIFFTELDSAGNILFTVRDSTPLNDFGNDCKATSDNGFIVAATSFGSPLDPDSADIFLIKKDQFGFTQWSNAYGGFGADRSAGVAITPDGGYFVAGFTNSGDSAFAQGFVLKTDFSGTPVWNRACSFFNNSGFTSCCVTTDSACIAAGYCDSSGFRNIFVVKFDNSGNVLWSKRFSAPGNQQANSVAATADGGCILAGSYQPNSSVNSADALLVRLSASGSILWAMKYNHQYEDVGKQVITLSSGGFALTGYSNVADTIAPVKAPGIFLIDSTGIPYSGSIFGDLIADNLSNSLAVAPDGGFLLGGVSYAGGRTNGISYFVKTDSTANTIFCENALTGGISPVTLTVDTSGAAVDSLFLNYTNFNLPQAIPSYNETLFCFAVSTKDQQEKTTVSIYPNPVSGQLTIDIPSSCEFTSVKILDAFGRLVIQQKISPGQMHFSVDTEKLKAGIYSAAFIGQQSFAVKKFVKAD